MAQVPDHALHLHVEGIEQLYECAIEAHNLQNVLLRGNDDIIREGGTKTWDKLNELLKTREPIRAHVKVFAGEKIRAHNTFKAKTQQGGALGAMGAVVF